MSDTDWPEVVHLMRTRNVSEAEAWRIVDERADARMAALEADWAAAHPEGGDEW
jgi:hypothetical protein